MLPSTKYFNKHLRCGNCKVWFLYIHMQQHTVQVLLYNYDDKEYLVIFGLFEELSNFVLLNYTL